MTVTLLSAVLLSTGIQPAPVRIYTDPGADIAISYPREWTAEQKRGRTTLLFPVETATAEVELLNTRFLEPIEKWHEYQRQAAEASGWTIERQWQEDLLGVPLVLNRVRQRDRITVTGMLFARNDRKLLFKLSSDPAVFEQADADWKKVLLTVRTVSGQLPLPEDPNRVIPAEPPKQGKKTEKPTIKDPEKPRPSIKIEPAFEPRPVQLPKGVQSLPAKAGGKDLVFFYPEAWTAKPVGDAFELSHPQVAGVVRVEPLAELDSGNPEEHLLKLSSRSLGDFSRVDSRRDGRPSRTRAGMTLLWVRRDGLVGETATVEYFAVGAKEGYYWALGYRASVPNFAQSEKRLNDLVQLLQVLVQQ